MADSPSMEKVETSKRPRRWIFWAEGFILGLFAGTLFAWWVVNMAVEGTKAQVHKIREENFLLHLLLKDPYSEDVDEEKPASRPSR